MNIFARELVSLLAEHGKELGSLYGLHSPDHRLFPSKVTRLKRSLSGQITATLNANDLDLLVKWLKLDPDGEEIRRLRAALLAEMIRHLLGGRMDVAVADELGDVAFQLLIGSDTEHLLKQRGELLKVMRSFTLPRNQPLAPECEEDILRGGPDAGQVSRGLGDILRGGPDAGQKAEVVSWNLTDIESDEMGLVSGPIKPALETAVEMYEQGELWLGIARDTPDPGTHQGYLAQAHALLRRAQDLAASASTSTPINEQDKEWLSIIGTSLKDLPADPLDDVIS